MRTIILLALFGAALAVPAEEARIVGGSATRIENYPYTANVEFGWLGSSFAHACGGTLIRENSVLSAAHCFVGFPAFWWRIRLGSSYRTSGGTFHNIAQIIKHPQYDIPRLNNDVAIVRLSNRAVLSNRIAIARIAGPNSVLSDGTPVNAVGWGILALGLGPPVQLQHVTLNVINQQLCAQRYANRPSLPDVSAGMFCAGILNVGGRCTCQGDSGGPVVYFDRSGHVVVGVTSWGYGCGHAHYPGVYARVSFYSNWIVNNA